VNLNVIKHPLREKHLGIGRQMLAGISAIAYRYLAEKCCTAVHI